MPRIPVLTDGHRIKRENSQMSSVQIATVVLTAVMVGAAGIGHALDCEGRLVSMGASPWDVQSICGDPAQVSDPSKSC